MSSRKIHVDIGNVFLSCTESIHETACHKRLDWDPSRLGDYSSATCLACLKREKYHFAIESWRFKKKGEYVARRITKLREGAV